MNMSKIGDQMENLTEGLSTKADKMRILERHGVPRADIARFLGVRYQQVRNTLEGDKRTGYNPEINPSWAKEAQFKANVFRKIEIGDDGFAQIPPDMLENIGDGIDGLVALEVDNGVFISSPSGMADRVRASFA